MITDTPKKTGPSIDRLNSRQDYATPPDFMEAVTKRFGKISFDLAASAENAKAPRFFTEQDDALDQHWHLLPEAAEGWLFLNPPYKNIGDWAEACAEESQKGTRILFLVPASTGSGWYWNHIKPYAYVLHLRQRISFVGETNPYPKDLILAAYAHGLTGDQPWDWKGKRSK